MEHLARKAPKAVYELEPCGVPFSRTEDGGICQRPFGGHTTEFGEGQPAERTCAGDGGGGMVARQGLPLQDMEFVRFHPARDLRLGVPDHRGRPRRGRLPVQLRGRAVHGALCADQQGPRLARRGLALHDDREPRGPRRRPEQGPHRAQPQPPAARGAGRAAARHLGERQDLRRRRRDQGADPGSADRPLQHGRHPDELLGRGPRPDRAQPRPSPPCRRRGADRRPPPRDAEDDAGRRRGLPHRQDVAGGLRQDGRRRGQARRHQGHRPLARSPGTPT